MKDIIYIEEDIGELVLNKIGDYLENDITQIYTILKKDFVYIKNNIEFIEEDLQLLEIVNCEVLDIDIIDINFKGNINNIEVKFHLNSIINTFNNKGEFLLRITIQSIKGIININNFNIVKILKLEYDEIEYDDLRCI